MTFKTNYVSYTNEKYAYGPYTDTNTHYEYSYPYPYA